MASPTFQLVVAATEENGIGNAGGLPWTLPGDMAYFRRLTSQTTSSSAKNAVIMGRKTWESIPAKHRPLKGRINIILSRCSDAVSTVRDQDQDMQEATHVEGAGKASAEALRFSGLHDALQFLASPEVSATVETIFVIGGGQVYQEAMKHPGCVAIHLTRIESDIKCDTFLPNIESSRFKLWSASNPFTENGVRYTFLCYTTTRPDATFTLPPVSASRHDEQQYLDLVDSIIKTGVFRPDRTGTGTFSKFGTSMRFNLRHTFPLLTTKRVFWRGVVEELLWFVRGSTNATELQAKDVRIWDGNSSRTYLDSIGLTEREEGDLGPVYGFQWRHFGAEYTNMHADYTDQGVDQLAEIIRRLKHNPHDRRLVMTAWNPSDLPIMALPPCHLLSQFYVANGELSCMLYQRSADVGLGVPFNIASYALLTVMVAQVCGLKPGEFVHIMGDTHVYANHVEPLKEQLQNTPRHFPTLRVNPEKREIDSFELSDFELVDYKPHKKIEMKMAV